MEVTGQELCALGLALLQLPSLASQGFALLLLVLPAQGVKDLWTTGGAYRGIEKKDGNNYFVIGCTWGYLKIMEEMETNVLYKKQLHYSGFRA